MASLPVALPTAMVAGAPRTHLQGLATERSQTPRGTALPLRAAGKARAHHDRQRQQLRAAVKVARSALPGEPEAPVRCIEILLAGLPSHLTEYEHAQRRVAAAGMILARARHGSAEDAVSLAAAELGPALVQRDPAIASTTLSSFWAATAEAYLTAGLVRDAASAAQRARQDAADAGSDALRYRSASLRALSYTLNGEYEPAEVVIRGAIAIERRHSWQNSLGTLLLRGSQIQLAAGRMDALGLIKVAESLGRLPQTALARALSAIATGRAALLTQRPHDGIAAITAVSHCADQNAIPALLRGFLAETHASLLILRGEPRRALSLLDAVPSTPEHSLCFGLQRSAALLELGSNREVLATTDDCIRLGHKHCLRTLPSVLLRRAIAHERLAHHDAADTAFVDAFLLMQQLSATDPILTLPADDFRALLARLCQTRPDLAEPAKELEGRLPLAPCAKHPALALPELTERETRIAHELRHPGTLSEIAARLYVSRNTVKTQVSSLYRKLGTAEREGAVSLLERAGFFG